MLADLIVAIVATAGIQSGPTPYRFEGSENYPAEAAVRGEQGTVFMDLSINVKGRVDGCGITESSGSKILDGASCAAVKRRVRYRPAKDASGSPVPGRASLSIGWRIGCDTPILDERGVIQVCRDTVRTRGSP